MPMAEAPPERQRPSYGLRGPLRDGCDEPHDLFVTHVGAIPLAPTNRTYCMRNYPDAQEQRFASECIEQLQARAREPGYRG